MIRRGGGSKRQTFVWIQMSSLPVPHLFLFPLWQGMLTFQENSTSLKRTANANNFLKVWFSWRLWFYHFGASGGLAGGEVCISFTRTSAWRMRWVLWPWFPRPLPLRRFWCETKWKTLFMFSLGHISWGPGEGERNFCLLTTYSRQMSSLNRFALAAFSSVARWIFWSASIFFLS